MQLELIITSPKRGHEFCERLCRDKSRKGHNSRGLGQPPNLGLNPPPTLGDSRLAALPQLNIATYTSIIDVKLQNKMNLLNVDGDHDGYEVTATST